MGDLSTLLRRFAEGEESEKTECFGGIVRMSSRFLAQNLQGKVPAALVEDACQDVWTLVWESRANYTFQGTGAWWKYLTSLSRSSKRRHKRADYVPLDDIASEADPSLDLLLDYIYHGGVLAAMDELWLGWPPDLSPLERNRRILAVKLHYLDKVPWRDICHMVGLLDDSLLPDRARLNEWLLFGPALLGTACDYLARDAEALADLVCWHVAHSDQEVNDWLRLQCAKFEDSRPIPAALNWPKDRVEDEFVGHMPFRAWLENFMRAASPKSGFAEMAGKDPFWMRVVSFYLLQDALRQKDIELRVFSPSSLAGNPIGGKKIENWISSRRMLNVLAKHMKGKYDDE